MNLIKRIIKVMNIAVFTFTTIAIAGVFYEGDRVLFYFEGCKK